MFTCPKCKGVLDSFQCPKCGYNVPQINSVWQLTDAPDIKTDGEGDKYIGYEHIGEFYSGNRKYMIEERDALFAGEISTLTGDGVFLDLGCGDGCLTVPSAANGTKVIAGDISNTMLSILQKKALNNHILLDTVTLCRMNALDVPLFGESVDTVACNSVLHLISNPEAVVREIWRVLKPGGVFICKDDRPGKSKDSEYDNSHYQEIASFVTGSYYNYVMAKGIKPVQYSWKFDRDSVCRELYSEKAEILIKYGAEYRRKLKDGLLPRLCGRGFSNQVNIPLQLHTEAVNAMLSAARNKFGENFDDVDYVDIEDDLILTVYKK